MLDPKHPLAELLRRDQRYHFDSYVFVFDSLRYAQEKLNMGRVAAASPGQDGGGNEPPEDASEFDDPSSFDASAEFENDDFDEEFEKQLDAEFEPDFDEEMLAPERHVSGQDLCEAIRCYALTQYGLLAQNVFHHWGIHSTDDFGEIVFNLIDIGQMRKTDNDRREDFKNVYDFAKGLTGGAVFADDPANPPDRPASGDDAEPSA